MKRPLRCRLGLHKRVLKRDETDGGKYYACTRCARIWGMGTIVLPISNLG